MNVKKDWKAKLESARHFDIFRWGNYLKVSRFYFLIDLILQKRAETIQGFLFKGKLRKWGTP